MKLAVIGSRNFDSYPLLKNTLDEVGEINLIISGGAKGADQLAERYALEINIPTHVIPPEYNKYDAKVAPVIRNRQIVDNADKVIAFWDGKSKGTGNVIEYAKKQRKLLKTIIYGKPAQETSKQHVSPHGDIAGGHGFLF